MFKFVLIGSSILNFTKYVSLLALISHTVHTVLVLTTLESKKTEADKTDEKYLYIKRILIANVFFNLIAFLTLLFILMKNNNKNDNKICDKKYPILFADICIIISIILSRVFYYSWITNVRMKGMEFILHLPNLASATCTLGIVCLSGIIAWLSECGMPYGKSRSFTEF